jgi:hypothetical protein
MLAFDAPSHTYTWHPADATVPGRRLLSVTEVLRRTGMIDTRFYTDESRLRGERVHKAVALDHDDTLDESSADDVMPWVLTWRRFCAESGFRVWRFEQQVCDEYRGYAGTYDVLGCFRDEGEPPILLDIKTGQPQAWVGPQTAAYARCLSGFHARYALHLTPDRYVLTELRDRNDEPIFLAALAVATWQVQHGQ